MADKEVYFHTYCPKCKHYWEDEAEDICNDCLVTPMNEDSHKPINYQQEDSQKKQ